MRTANIIDHFASMPDSREDNRRHKLIDILFIVICATVCGAEEWEDVDPSSSPRRNTQPVRGAEGRPGEPIEKGGVLRRSSG